MGGARRSGRIAKEIAIVLLGTDTTGRVFSENTSTVVLSRHGAGILSRNRPDPDENLTIRFQGGNAEAAVRLVGEMGENARGHVYGVAFVDPDLDFWEWKFSPPQRPGDADVTMECSVCQTRDTVNQTEVEADVYVLAGCILRSCAHCGTSTEWRRASGDAAIQSAARGTTTRTLSPNDPRYPKEASSVPHPKPVQTPCVVYATEPSELVEIRSGRTSAFPVEAATPKVLAQPALPPAATSVVARRSNRRRDVRTCVSFTACVRHAGSEEIVECDNISRGGLSFRSRKSYAIGSMFEVAVPYSPGSPAIFVSATVRHIEALNVGSLFRYGAAYVCKGFFDSPPIEG